MNWTLQEKDFINRFKKPYDIQQFLDAIPYNPNPECRSPRFVIKEPKAHCFEGALFAAAMLNEMGHKPLIIDMFAVNDDDHVIAVFQVNKRWGAIAKSNTTALRYREPVYKTVRELMMSYFDFYFNTLGEKSLRSYSRPVDLNRFSQQQWMFTDADLEFIGDYLTQIHHYLLIDKSMEETLQPVDKRLLDAVFMGADFEGLFKPKA